MSWNPLRKFGSFRSTTGNTGTETTTESGEVSGASGGNANDDFESESMALTSVTNSCKKIIKTAHKMTHSLESLSRMEVKLTNDLSNSSLCQSNNEFRNVTEEWHSLNMRLQEGTTDYTETVTKTVMDPSKRILKMLEEFRQNIKKSQDMQHKILKNQEKVKKLKDKEKTGSNLVHLQKQKMILESLENQHKTHQEVLAKELPQFLDNRIHFIQSSIEAYSKAVVLFWAETLTALTSFPFLSSMQSNRVNEWPVYQEKQRKLMKQLEQLSIVEGNE